MLSNGLHWWDYNQAILIINLKNKSKIRYTQAVGSNTLSLVSTMVYKIVLIEWQHPRWWDRDVADWQEFSVQHFQKTLWSSERLWRVLKDEPSLYNHPQQRWLGHGPSWHINKGQWLNSGRCLKIDLPVLCYEQQNIHQMQVRQRWLQRNLTTTVRLHSAIDLWEAVCAHSVFNQFAAGYKGKRLGEQLS